MIKNLNDLLTFICLIILTLLSFRVFLTVFVAKKGNDSSGVSKIVLIRDYIDNEEE